MDRKGKGVKGQGFSSEVFDHMNMRSYTGRGVPPVGVPSNLLREIVRFWLQFDGLVNLKFLLSFQPHLPTGQLSPLTFVLLFSSKGIPLHQLLLCFFCACFCVFLHRLLICPLKRPWTGLEAVAKQFLTFWQHYTWTEVRRRGEEPSKATSDSFLMIWPCLF